ncbi:hypothetical protein BSP18_010 [Bacillus phage BSP18]|nr:hypothetical protein BSP18_010 [Bacillus phage BSP18]
MTPRQGMQVLFEGITVQIASRRLNGFYKAVVLYGDDIEYFEGDTIQLHEETLVKKVLNMG